MSALTFALDRAVGPLPEGQVHPDAEKHAGIAAQPIENLAGGHLSHDDAARVVRMLYRSDIDHEGVVTIARDRIAWLAGQLARRDEAVAELVEANKAPAAAYGCKGSTGIHFVSDDRDDCVEESRRDGSTVVELIERPRTALAKHGGAT